MLRGRYEIVEQLGSGTQGVAFSVRDHVVSGQLRVLKVFDEREASGALTAFEVLTQLASPFLPPAQSFFIVNAIDRVAFERETTGLQTESVQVGQACLVRNRVEGEPADEWMKTHPWEDRARLLWRMATCLRELHRAGFLHGDLKPEHILVDDNDQPVLIDFGLAQQSAGTTTAGGTPLYMAPELFQGTPASVESELYSFGALSYQLAAGQPPFTGDTLRSVIKAHIESPVPELGSDIPARAQALIRRLLNKEPSDRPGLDEVVETLRPDGATVQQRAILPFSGRDDALQSVLTRCGHGLSTWVIGAPGIGKTRFLQHLRWHAEATGVITLEAPPGPTSLEAKVEAIGRQLGDISGVSVGTPPRSKGDRIGRIRALREWLDELVPKESVFVFWDDAHLLPDHRAFLLEYQRSAGQLVFVTSVVDPEGLSKSEVGVTASPVAPRGLSIELGPLDDNALVACASRVGESLDLTPAVQRRATKRCQGNPRVLQLELTQAATRKAGKGEIQTAPPSDTLRARLMQILRACPESPPLALVAEALDRQPDELLAVVQQLIAQGELVRVENTFAPVRLAERLEIFSGTDAETLLRLAELLKASGRKETARVLRILAGDHPPNLVKKASDALLEADHRHFALHLLGAVVQGGANRWVRPFVELALQLDQAEQALSYVPLKDKPDLVLARARLQYTLGRLEDAKQTLSHLGKTTLRLEESAEAAALGLWVALRSGRYEEALEIAGTSTDPGSVADAAVSAELATTQAAALLLSGKASADEAIEKAQKLLLRAGGMPRLAARLLTVQAIAATRRGDLEAARDRYGEALQVVEEAELDADLPTFLLNAGTAHDHLGQLAAARTLYQRGARLAGEHVTLSTRIFLMTNQANISLRLNRLDEAEELIERAAQLAGDEATDRAALFVRRLRAELDLQLERYSPALEQFEKLIELLSEVGDANILAEESILAARAALGTNDVSAAKAHLARGKELVETHDFNDLKALALTVEGELLHQAGADDDAVTSWKKALDVAKASGEPFRITEAAEHLLRAQSLTGPQKDSAAEALIKIVEGLGAGLKSDYLEMLPKSLRSLLPSPATTLASGEFPKLSLPAHSPGLEDRLFRLLSLTARLARETDPDRMLERALEMAIELSGAERGFLLLRKGNDLRVTISRDVDGESIRRAILKVSLTFAEQVAETGEPMTTVNAQSDDRFKAARSVHQLALTSILCLPVRIFGKVVAVIYLDHRFKAAAFPPEVVRLMMALADQLAVSMLYIDRVKALEGRNVEVENARERVEQLLAEKEGLAHALKTRCDDLESSLRAQRRSAPLRYRYDEIVASTPAMISVLERVDRVVDSAIPVLVSGESGTGKELIARAVHYNGPRTEAPFIPINCGAIPENLLESELFGHIKGSFTGADRDNPGLFTAANGGTVFLDEIGELPLMAQVKLLRAIQERKVRPVGGVKDRDVDVRLVAASNRDLLEMVNEKTFRADLYYRLAGLELQLPPLRDRREDIPLLVDRFLQELQRDGEQLPKLDDGAIELLFDYDWPGNVRQLRNVLEAGLAMSDGEFIRGRDVAPLMRTASTGLAKRSAVPSRRKGGGRRGPKPKAKRGAVLQALREAQGDIDRASDILGVTPRSVYRYIARWGIELE